MADRVEKFNMHHLAKFRRDR